LNDIGRETKEEIAQQQKRSFSRLWPTLLCRSAQLSVNDLDGKAALFTLTICVASDTSLYNYKSYSLRTFRATIEEGSDWLR
jgi:hypothetical protein